MGREIVQRLFRNDSSNGLIWNAIGGSLFAGQSVIVLFLCARFYDQETAGVVSISYAIAMLIQMIALYGVRNYQVTDIGERYRFEDYLSLRLGSILLAVLVLFAYMLVMSLFNGYTLHKSATVIAMSLLKMVNAFEDVLIGRYQQRGFFVVGARMGTIREFLTLVTIIIVICIRCDILVALALGTIVGIVTEYVLLKKTGSYLNTGVLSLKEFDFTKISGLAKECLPLCISTVLAIYLSNIPKYVTDWYLDELTQAIVGYLLLPVFTIALLNQFIYTPFIKDLGDLWNEGDNKGFGRRVCLQSFIIILSSGFILVISYWIGIPLLSFVYDIDLSPYIKEFALLLIGGGLYALEYYLIIPVTVIHEQKKILSCYLVVIIITLSIQKSLVVRYDLVGVGMTYIIANLLIAATLCLVIFRKYRCQD